MFALVFIYPASYLGVRYSHAFPEVNKDTDPVEVEYHTLFDTYSRIDSVLFWLYLPASTADQALTGRRFYRDKY